jgi:hypothetical protein
MNDRGLSEFDLVDITTYSKDVDVAVAREKGTEQ